MSDSFVRTGTVDVNKRIDAEALQVGGIDVFRLRTTSGPMAVRLDQADANTLYVGEALPGTTDASAAWRVRKVLTVGTVTSILYANGESSFINIWDNRAGLNYV